MANPRQEHSSTSFLGQAGIEIYYPGVKESFNVGGRRRFRRSGLFPGYFFARFDYEREYRIISYPRGGRKVVAVGHIAAEVDPGLLREIQENIQKRDVVQVPIFRPGDVVRINSGPCAGIRAVFESAMPRKEQAVVLLHVLSCQSRADLEHRGPFRSSLGGRDSWGRFLGEVVPRRGGSLSCLSVPARGVYNDAKY